MKLGKALPKSLKKTDSSLWETWSEKYILKVVYDKWVFHHCILFLCFCGRWNPKTLHLQLEAYVEAIPAEVVTERIS